MFAPKPRKGMPPVKLDRNDFAARFRAQFKGHAFDALGAELDRITDAAWEEYAAGHKSPHTRKAGPGFADPDYDLAVDWIAARAAIDKAQHKDRSRPPRILLINGSTRSEHTCPGEMSKSWQLVQIAREVLEEGCAEVDVLDLSRTASEYGRNIHPCKGLLLHGRRALPLAVFLLSDLFAGAGVGLDERHLSDVGGGAWDHDRHPPSTGIRRACSSRR